MTMIPRFFSVRLQCVILSLGCVLAAVMPAGAQANNGEVKGDEFAAKFANGWLVEWKNTATGEVFKFGEPKIPAGNDYRHYRPGFWSIDAAPADEEARRQQAVSFEFRTEGPGALALRESVTGVTNRLLALQWGVQVPYGDGLQVHWPRGLPPSRVSAAGFQESLLGEDYFFNNRPSALVGTYKLRSNAYVIQGKQGGLLIYMDDSDLKNFMAFEFLPIDPGYKPGESKFRDFVSQGIIISNRSIKPPTQGDSYAGPRWVIQQYKGGIAQAGQIYRDFVEKAYDITPLAKRPTSWVQDLGLVFVNSAFALRGPKTVEGKGQPAYNYLSEEAWVQGMKDDTEYLERLAKVMEPDKVLFYTTEWATGGHDTAFPEFNPDPYVAMMSRKARAMGFHVMLHMHNSLVQYPLPFTDKYILQTARYMGLNPEKDHIPGPYYDELRSEYIQQHDKEFGTTWNDRSGQRRVFNAFHMNPASGGWRWLFANRIVSALIATGADAVHLDVPDWMVERYNDKYGMNPVEGQAAFYRLLRQLLDEAGLQKVAISCELTPNESFMRYVDLAQRSRNNSTRSRMEALAKGSALAGEYLITLQTGKSLDSILKERKDKDAAAVPPLDAAKAMELFKQTSADLGVPSFDNAAFSAFVQCYPHLGAGLPDSPAGYLAAWYWFVNDCIPTGTGGDLTKPVSPFYYGVLALGRFRTQEGMMLAAPGTWAAGDLAAYTLKDGRRLRVYRADATTLRLQYEKGPVLAELDVFTGWKNAEALFKYGPGSVQIATPAQLAEAQKKP